MLDHVRPRTLLVAMACAIALAAPALPQPAPPIAIGPYVQNVSANSAAICWATVSGQVTFAPPEGEAATVRSYEVHSILLRRLQPGTTYAYDILGDGSDAGKGTFTTFPEGEQPFDFIVLGDTRSRHDIHRRIVERITAETPDLVFNTGDLVSDGRDISGWETFFDINRDLMRSVPYYPVLGNHEKDSRFYFDFFTLPGNERHYSFNRGPAHFVALDIDGPEIPETNQAITKEQQERFDRYLEQYFERQLAWLQEDLAGHQDAKYVFVFFHNPLYSVRSSRVEGAKELRAKFGTIFQDQHVTAVFSGHDHYYHRAVDGGVQFVVTGGGGAPLYDTDAPQPETVKFAKVEHYVRVDVGPDAAKARVIDIDGTVIDEFEMPARVHGLPTD